MPARLADARADGPTAAPYVIKVTDGRRTWQIEIPSGAGAPTFEASIPLELSEQTPPAGGPATEADRELLAEQRARGEKVPEATDVEAPSYLRTLSVVRALYQNRQYELALVELVKLERHHPEDLRILEMKGTLLSRLGRIEEARAAWERALALDPGSPTLRRALDGLDAREE